LKSKNYISIEKLKRQPKLGMSFDLDGLNKSLKSFGQSKGFKEINSQLDGFVKTLKPIGSTLDSVKTALSANISEFDQLGAGIGRAQAYQEDYNKAVLQAIKNQNFLEESNKELNKAFGMSSKGAVVFAQNLRKLVADTDKTTDGLKIGSKKLFEYAANLKEMTGGFISSKKASQEMVGELIKTQAYLQNNIGLSAEGANSFELYAAGIGKTGAQAAGEIEQMSRALEKFTGIDAVQQQQQIIQDIASMGADLQLQYGGVGNKLEVATMKARLLGTSMEALHGTGKSLLNIESSIGAEMEYQQLTGRRLLDNQGKSLTNEYRMATVTGNSTKQAELMNQFIASEGKTLEKNLFARQKAAELMGTDEATLAKMIQKRKLLVSLNAEEVMNMTADDAQDKIADMRAKAVAAGETEKVKKIDELIKTSDTRTTAQVANDHLEAIRESVSVDGVSALGPKGAEDAGAAMAANRKAIFDGNNAMINFAKDANETFKDANFIKGVGALGIAGDRLSATLTPLRQLAETGIPLVSKKLGDLAKGLEKVTKIVKGPLGSDIKTTEEVSRNATGGFISGPGTGTSDSIPARLSDGEYVINAAATKRYKPLLDKINSGPVKLAAGGMVSNNGKMEALLSSILTTLRGNNVLGETSMNGRKRV